jgi:hypothetical protein
VRSARARQALRRHVAGGAFTLAVAAMTGANRSGLIGVRAFASTPQATLEGKVWLLATSGFVADRPTLPSLLAFVVFGLVAVRVCGARATWASAAVGHVGSAALMYGLIAAVRALVPDAFAGVFSLPDYGTSAIIAAWLGVVAASGWRRNRSLAARIGIAGFCALSGLVGWLYRPDLTPLDFEHVIAFALGAAVVVVPVPRLHLREWLSALTGSAPEPQVSAARRIY